MKQHTVTLLVLSIILMSTISGKRVCPSPSGYTPSALETTVVASKGNEKVGG